MDDLLKVGPLINDRNVVKHLEYNDAVTEVFAHDHMARKVLQLIGSENFEEAVKALVELTRVKNVMEILRRYFGPVSGAGTQCTEWETHRALAKLTLEMTQEKENDNDE